MIPVASTSPARRRFRQISLKYIRLTVIVNQVILFPQSTARMGFECAERSNQNSRSRLLADRVPAPTLLYRLLFE
jgi:hypothetical protein